MLDDAQTELPPLGNFRPQRADPTPADGEAEVHLGDVAADPDSAPPRTGGTRANDAVTLFAAVSAHAIALLALMTAPPTQLGGGGRSLDAISISIVPASALESREQATPVTAGAASGPMAPAEGDDVATSEASPDKRAEIKPPEPEQEPTRDPPRETPIAETAAAPPLPAPDAVTEAPSAVEAPPPEKPVEEQKTALVEPPPPPPEPLEKPPDKSAETPSPDALQQGGVASRGIAPDLPPAPAAAAAIPGEVHAYGLAIQSALLAVDQSEVRSRRALSRTAGTTVVRFAIRPNGLLASAEIQTSSGRRELDDAAIALVRLTAFPPPPPGLSDSQRTYVAPIVFRP